MPRPKKPCPWDEVQAAEAIVDFYEKKLEEALERLGRALELARHKKRPRLYGRAGA